MNANQQARYNRHWSGSVREHDTHRRASCNYCGFVATERRGRGTNALASHAKLFGKIAAHLRAEHADKLAEEPDDEDDAE